LFDKIPEVGEYKEVFGYTFTIIRKTQQNIEFVKLELVESMHDDQDN
jgi:Mg2+/Co2+ transporter CorB